MLQSLGYPSPPTLSSPRPIWPTGHLQQFARDPLSFVQECAQDHGDLVPLRFGSNRLIFLNHPDYIEEAYLRQNTTFMRKGIAVRGTAKMLLGNGMFMSEGSFYRRQRALMQPAFHKQMILDYAQVMTAETTVVIDQWQDGEVRDIYQDFIAITRSIIAKTMLGMGLPPGTGEQVTEALDATMDHFKHHVNRLLMIPDWFPMPDNIRCWQAMHQFNRLIDQLVTNPPITDPEQPTFLDLLMAAHQEPGRLTLAQLRDEVINIFLAGHETTAITLSWLAWKLSQTPDSEARLVEELHTVLHGRTPTVADLPQLPYTEAIALETLRLYPPVWAMTRVALEDTDLNGYPIQKGNEVMACQWTAHRDPRFFPDPEQFFPDRWLDGLAKRLPQGAYFPFSLGARNCLGHAFGKIELVLLVAEIFQRFHLTLVPDHPVEFFPSLTLRPKHGMRMVIQKR